MPFLVVWKTKIIKLDLKRVNVKILPHRIEMANKSNTMKQLKNRGIAVFTAVIFLPLKLESCQKENLSAL